MVGVNDPLQPILWSWGMVHGKRKMRYIVWVMQYEIRDWVGSSFGGFASSSTCGSLLARGWSFMTSPGALCRRWLGLDFCKISSQHYTPIPLPPATSWCQAFLLFVGVDQELSSAEERGTSFVWVGASTSFQPFFYLLSWSTVIAVMAWSLLDFAGLYLG